MTLAAGTRLGAFEILAPLGAGGMGEVYRARDVKLGRDVAVKVLARELASDPARLKRFEQEARGASALNHPSIVTIYEIGEEGGLPFLVMELVAGKTLRELLLDGAVPPKRLFALAAQVGHGLATAHDAGIVHRDLKPDNLMVTRDGQVKILDFGLAKLTRKSLDSGDGAVAARTLTEPGDLLGTVGYMSPEQASGQPADFRSDQFSLGAILYEMATGERAFRGETSVDTLSSILHADPPPLSQRRPELPLPFAWAIERCLAKDPGERYASTTDLARDLDAIHGHWTSAPDARLAAPPRAAPSRRILLGASVAGAVVAVIAGAFLAGRATDPVRGALRSISSQRVTFRRGNITAARFAPDGETIIYSAAWEGNPQEVYSTSIRSPESHPLGIRNAQLLSVSERGELAVLLKKGNLLSGRGVGTVARVSPAGGTPRELVEEVGRFVDWGRGGALAVVRESDDGKTRIEYPIGKVVFETSVTLHSPRVSPDGERIAFFDATGGKWAIAVVDRVGNRKALLTMEQFGGLGDLAWHPSGDEIWFNATEPERGDALYAVDLSGRFRVVTRPLDRGVLLDISRDGKVLLERETYRLELLYRGPDDAGERDLSWFDRSSLNGLSRDGKSILFTEYQGANRGVYLRPTDGSPAVRLAEGYGLAIAPDGESVLVSVPKPGLAAFRIDRVPTRAGLAESLPVGDLQVEDADWLPDGRRVFLSAIEPGGTQRGFLLDLPRGKPRPFGGGWLGGFSRDGRFATMGGSSGKWELLAVDSEEARPIPGLEAGEVVGQITADGKQAYVFRFGGIPVQIARVNLTTGERLPWRELAPLDRSGLIGITSFEIGADDLTYAYNIERVIADDLHVIKGLN